GMDGHEQVSGLINSFSLVAYLPEPLASFVDPLRHELQPGSTARGHVTLLPPRPIECNVERACTEIEAVISEEFSFDVYLGKVEVFPASKVVHLSIAEGFSKLIRLHRSLNRGACNHLEAFYYHPHVTLAQGLPLDDVNHAAQIASERWAAYHKDRFF